MDSLKNMLGILKPLKLYDLEEESLVSCELAAYAAAFRSVEQKLNWILRESFITTAQEEGLNFRESLFALVNQQMLSLTDRRNMLLYAKRMPSEDSTKAGIVLALKGIGFHAEISENTLDEKLEVICTDYTGRFIDHNTLALRVADILPAHLLATLYFNFFTWDMADGYDLTFDRWDNFNYTCDQLEKLGDQTLEID